MRISWQKILLKVVSVGCKNTILIKPVKRVSNLIQGITGCDDSDVSPCWLKG
jgi:hypothetical protein